MSILCAFPEKISTELKKEVVNKVYLTLSLYQQRLDGVEIENACECLMKILSPELGSQDDIRVYCFSLTPPPSQERIHMPFLEVLVNSLNSITTDESLKEENKQGMEASSNKKLSSHNYTVIFLLRNIKTLLTTAKMS